MTIVWWLRHLGHGGFEARPREAPCLALGKLFSKVVRSASCYSPWGCAGGRRARGGAPRALGGRRGRRGLRRCTAAGSVPRAPSTTPPPPTQSRPYIMLQPEDTIQFECTVGEMKAYLINTATKLPINKWLFLQKETLPAAYSRLLGRLLVMRTGKAPHWLPRGVAMRTFVHPQPIVLQVIICHDNREHWGPTKW